jgi:hypothetical protein
MTIYFPLQLAVKCEGPAAGRVCLVLLTDLIIRVGGKLLCQVFLSFKWFGWCGLGGNWGVEGLDKKTGIRGKKEQGRGFCGGRFSRPSQSTRWMGYPVRPHLSRDETAAKMGHPAIFPVRAMGYELCGMRMECPAVYAYADMRSWGSTIAY